MRAIRRAISAALLGAAALAPWAPPAAAAARFGAAAPTSASTHEDGAFQAQVTPTVVAAGGQVLLTASGCRGDTTVSSGVFDTVRIRGHAGAATATVDDDARPGAEYQVRFECADGAVRTAGLTIAGGHGGHGDEGASQAHKAMGEPQHGVRAGTGGSLGGFDFQQLAVGALLLAGALGLAYRHSGRHCADAPPDAGPPIPDPAAPANRTAT